MVKIIGDSPRPWAFTIGVEQDSALARSLEHLFPTVTPVEDLGSIRQLDYNAAIVVDTDAQRFLESHLQVVWFSDWGTAPVKRPGNSGSNASVTRWEDGDRAARFGATVSATAHGLGSLAERLAPPAASEYMVLSKTNWLKEFRHALLVEVAGKFGALAAIYDRNSNKSSEVWCLPLRALDDGSSWVGAALQRWRDRFPEAFPTADWAADERWLTAQEQVAQSGLNSHDVITAALLEARRGERTVLETAVEEARAAADAGARHLLTTNGDLLVQAVVVALEQLGFDVIQSDEVLPAGQKREDLLVQDGTWVSVTEVKGYEKGNAKQNDLLPLGSAVESYVLRTRQTPSARWYIVNQSYRTPPDARPRPLAGAGDTVEKFSMQQGLVIDTRDLFFLSRAVSTGQISAIDARQLLREARGVFDYPARTSEELLLEAGREQLALPAGESPNLEIGPGSSDDQAEPKEQAQVRQAEE